MKVLILPGLGNSGPEHWQTCWEIDHNYDRVREPDFSNPVKDVWVGNLEKAVAEAGPETVLVAHSLGCLQVAHWADQTRLPIHGALLVAPPNPDRPDFPKNVIGFSPVPHKILPFKSIVVASTNDPYAKIEYSQALAKSWGSLFVNIGDKGHINTASGVGSWPDGFKLLERLLK